ncbi:MAG TPA: TonB family protein [Thermoanaerobaculia bacterium]|nr:TonB family protein [Thermoanaerobaculia bacterium]
MTMKLAGDLAEFSLADLVQVAGIAGRTCCVRVLAADGNGTLYLQGGEVVSAVFEDLSGFDAFVALVAARAGHFQVENGAQPEQRNLQGNVQKLLLQANTRIEGGDVPKASRRPLPGPLAASTTSTASAASAASAGMAAGAGVGAAREPGPASAAGSRLWIGVAAALLLLAAASWLAFARHDAAAGTAAAPGSGAAAAPPAPARPAVEATQLTGPRDAPPALVSGPPAMPPDPTAALKPTIVCRVLIGVDGRVADAKIYRSRLDLAAFEDAALDAVRKYRFTPGRLAGAPVPVWINWPVSFR